MTAHPLEDLSVLDVHISQALPPGAPPDRRTFYSPVDDVHGALKDVLSSAQRSLVIAMYGFDDDELAQIIKSKLVDENIYVQLTLDSSQAGGVHERALLASENYPASTIAVGRSERGAIMHLKEGIVDGTIVFSGSTNWSTGGESLQDNELTVTFSAFEAAIATARLGAIHASMLARARP